MFVIINQRKSEKQAEIIKHAIWHRFPPGFTFPPTATASALTHYQTEDVFHRLSQMYCTDDNNGYPNIVLLENVDTIARKNRHCRWPA